MNLPQQTQQSDEIKSGKTVLHRQSNLEDDSLIFEPEIQAKFKRDISSIKKFVEEKYNKHPKFIDAVTRAAELINAGEITNACTALASVQGDFRKTLKTYIDTTDEAYIKALKVRADPKKTFDEGRARSHLQDGKTERKKILEQYDAIISSITKVKDAYLKSKETVAVSADESAVMNKNELAANLQDFTLPPSTLYNTSVAIDDINTMLQKDAVLLVYGNIPGLTQPAVYKAKVLGFNIEKDIVKVSMEYPPEAIKAGRENGETCMISIKKLLEKAAQGKVRLDLSF